MGTTFLGTAVCWLESHLFHLQGSPCYFRRASSPSASAVLRTVMAISVSQGRYPVLISQGAPLGLTSIAVRGWERLVCLLGSI